MAPAVDSHYNGAALVHAVVLARWRHMLEPLHVGESVHDFKKGNCPKFETG